VAERGQRSEPGQAGEPGRPPFPLRLLRGAGRMALAMGFLGVFLALGAWVADALALPVPGSVIGMVALAGALQLRVIRVRWVRPAADLLLRHMGLLFVPPGVAVMVHTDLIRDEWLPILAGSAVSTLAVLVVVGWVQQRMERRDGTP
jgi:holin-like protein